MRLGDRYCKLDMECLITCKKWFKFFFFPQGSGYGYPCPTPTTFTVL